VKSVLHWLVVGYVVLQTHDVHAQKDIEGLATVPDNHIAFQLDRGFLILVEGRIGPLAPIKFILDTGATHTLVDERIAEKLHLTSKGRGKILNFDKSLDVDRIDLPDIQLGPIHASKFPAIVGKLRKFSEFAGDADAIIGMDLIGTSKSIRVDFRTHVLTFTTAREGETVNSSGPRALVAVIQVQDQAIHLIIDTGLQGIFLYADRLRKRLPQITVSEKPVPASSGRLSGQQVTIAGIRLGSEELQSPILLFRGVPDGLPPIIDGYLGTNTLHAKVIELDFVSSKMRWQ
jgi:predicted aspartyl protease